MPALIAGIRVFAAKQGVDGRDKPGHDKVIKKPRREAGFFSWEERARDLSRRLKTRGTQRMASVRLSVVTRLKQEGRRLLYALPG
jgi:hypothetical protein